MLCNTVCKQSCRCSIWVVALLQTGSLFFPFLSIWGVYELFTRWKTNKTSKVMESNQQVVLIFDHRDWVEPAVFSFFCYFFFPCSLKVCFFGGRSVLRQCAFGCVPVVHSSAVTATNSIDVSSFLVSSLRLDVLFFFLFFLFSLKMCFCFSFPLCKLVLSPSSLSLRRAPACKVNMCGTSSPMAAHALYTEDKLWTSGAIGQHLKFCLLLSWSQEAKNHQFFNCTHCYWPVQGSWSDADGTGILSML